jgi:hypothetical protein
MSCSTTTPGLCWHKAIAWVGPDGLIGSSKAGKPSSTLIILLSFVYAVKNVGLIPLNTTLSTLPDLISGIKSEKVIDMGSLSANAGEYAPSSQAPTVKRTAAILLTKRGGVPDRAPLRGLHATLGKRLVMIRITTKAAKTRPFISTSYICLENLMR